MLCTFACFATAPLRHSYSVEVSLIVKMGSCCGDKESKKGFCPFSLFLFAATGAAFAYHKLQQKKSRDESGAATKPQVVFVLGGPGM